MSRTTATLISSTSSPPTGAGTVDIFYYISASWYAGNSSSIMQATRLASAVNVRIEAPDPVTLYDGPVTGLIEQPRDGGRLLPIDWAHEDLTFTLTLRKDAGAGLMGINLMFDLIFVAN